MNKNIAHILGLFLLLSVLNNGNVVHATSIGVIGSIQQLDGTVTFNNVPWPGTEVVLYFYDGTQWSPYLFDTTNSNGEYSFFPSQLTSDAEAYAVTWDNTTNASDKLAYWICNPVSTSELSLINQRCSFDIANIELGPPSQNEAINFPSQFTWTRRFVTTDQYAVDIYDESNTTGVQWQSSVVPYFKGSIKVGIDTAPLIEANKEYSWRVTVYGANGLGASNSANTIKFTESITRVFLPKIENSVAQSTPSQMFGRVTENGVPVNGLPINLWYYDGSTWTINTSTQTNSSGDYLFTDLPALSDANAIAVTWENNTQNNTRLVSWLCLPLTNQLHTFANAECNFDVADVLLTGPTINPGYLPITFSWDKRFATPEDSYEVNILDLSSSGDQIKWWWSEPSVDSTFSLDYLPQMFVNGNEYAWWMRVYGKNGYGDSYYYAPINIGTVSQSTSSIPKYIEHRKLSAIRSKNLYQNISDVSSRKYPTNTVIEESPLANMVSPGIMFTPSASTLIRQLYNFLPNSSLAVQNNNLIVLRLGAITEFTFLQGGADPNRDKSLLKTRFENAMLLIAPNVKFVYGIKVADGEFCLLLADNSTTWCGNVTIQPNQGQIAFLVGGAVPPLQFFMNYGNNNDMRVFYTPVNYVAGTVGGIPGGATSFRVARFTMSCCIR